MVDIAHISGLVATKQHSSPFGRVLGWCLLWKHTGSLQGSFRFVYQPQHQLATEPCEVTKEEFGAVSAHSDLHCGRFRSHG